LKNRVIYIAFVVFSFNLIAQHKNGWIWPLKREIRLTGNYGELRPNHFHPGLDLATGQEHIPVVAIADGYLFRIKSSTYGYGNAVYIGHADNYTSLYAHLYSYSRKIQAYVDSLRFHYEMYEVDCYLGKDSLFIKQGDTIGYSGNTGASMGAHLHFEIRRTDTEVPMNPLRYFRMYDNVKPVIGKVQLVPMLDDNIIDESSNYITLAKPELNKKKNVSKKRGKKKKSKKRKGGFDDDFLKERNYNCDYFIDFESEFVSSSEKHIDQLPKKKQKGRKKKSKVIVKQTKKKSLQTKTKIVVAKKSKVNEGDSMTDSLNKMGVDTHLKVVNIDSQMKHNNTFKVPKKFGIQLSTYDSDLGGSANNIYAIYLYLDSVLKVEMRMDSMSFDDLRYINTYLDLSGKAGGQMQRLFKTKNNDLPIFQKMMDRGVIALNDTNEHLLSIRVEDINRNYSKIEHKIKWDNKGVNSNTQLKPWNCNKVNVYETAELIIGTDAKTFYNDVNPVISETITERPLVSKAFRVFTDNIYFHKWISIAIKPFVVADSLKDKLCLVLVSGKSVSYVSSEYYNGKVSGLNRKPGVYGILLDTTAPKAEVQFNLTKLKSNTLRFKVGDNLSGIKQFKLYLNGKYVQALHESKVSSIFYVMSDEEKLNLETVRFEIKDNKDNISILNLHK
jgi:hypothetical protein